MERLRRPATFALLLAFASPFLPPAGPAPALANEIAPKPGGLDATCASLLLAIPKFLAQVEASPALKLRAMKLAALVTSPNPQRLAIEGEAAQLLAGLRDENVLQPALAFALQEAKKHPGFPKQLPGDDAQIVAMLYGEIDAALIEMGLSIHGAKAAVKSWAALAKEQVAAILRSGVAKIQEAAFVPQLERLIRARFLPGNRVKLLSDPGLALRERIRAIEGARKSIHLMTWAMYGDAAGDLFADLLIKKARQGVQVRVVVDGLTAQRVGYKEAIAKLRANGVEVVEWRNADSPYQGQHRKFLIVDAETGEGRVIAGGRNLGDQYLHTGEKSNDWWRDTDVLYSGPAVRENQRLFARVWNEQMDRLADARPGEASRYHALKLAEREAEIAQRPARGGVRMAVVDHTPNAEGIDPIYLGLLKSIDGATRSIDIANAYVVLTPALRDAIVRARERGVRVRVFTNSAQSVDEPVVSVPILQSLAELIPHGVEVHVKRGATLHSKLAIFDGRVSWVMSYNLHPRSLVYEGEVANVVWDRAFAAALTRDFEADLAIAQAVRTVAELNIPASAFARAVGTYFFNRL